MTNLETPELDEKVWRAWVEKGRARDKVNAKRQRMWLTIVAAIAAVGASGYYLLGY